MYGYGKYIKLSIQEILKRTTEEEIFNIVIQDEIIKDKGAMYVAPYRSDSNPNCYFEDYDGSLRFVDFASEFPVKSMDCVQMIKVCYNVSYIEALKIINDKLSLGLGDNYGKTKEILYEHGYVEEKDKKIFKERTITFVPRQFNYKDKQFWLKYGITKQNLLDNKVKAVEIYRFVSKKGKTYTVRPIDICYAFTEFTDLKGNIIEGKVKIYRPYAHKEAKWITNCNQDVVGSLQFLPEIGETLIITKSLKDCIVLRNFGLTVIWFQNEGMVPNDEILFNIIKRFKNIVVWFDNDSTGIANAYLVKEHIETLTKKQQVSTLTLPPILLKEHIKDPSDYYKIRGKNALLQFLKDNNLI